MMDLDSIVEILNYGGFAVMSAAFVTLLWLNWRKDARGDKVLGALTDRNETAKSLLEVVRSNTEAMQCVKSAVHENSRIIERLDLDFTKKLDELGRDIRELRGRV